MIAVRVKGKVYKLKMLRFSSGVSRTVKITNEFVREGEPRLSGLDTEMRDGEYTGQKDVKDGAAR